MTVSERFARLEEKLDYALKLLEKTKCDVHSMEISSLQGNIKWIRNIIIGWMSLVTGGVIGLFIKNILP